MLKAHLVFLVCVAGGFRLVMSSVAGGAHSASAFNQLVSSSVGRRVLLQLVQDRAEAATSFDSSNGRQQTLYASTTASSLDVLAAATAAPTSTSPAGVSTTASHINPSVLVVVVILSVVFILSGFLHFLARCLGRSSRRGRAGGISSAASQAGRSHELLAAQYYDQSAAAISALHGQLQHLFHLHDAGVEQAFIDTLPVFCYGSIRGLKDSADCAVCLNEFGEEDRLRLLPKCKHAFHLECIDTWLLSNSTCPLCRRSLLPDPIVGSAAVEIADHAGTSSNSTLVGASVAVADHQLQAGSLRAPSFRSAAAGSSLRRGGSNLCESSFRIREAAAAEEDEEEEDQCEIQVEEEPESIGTPSPLVPTVRVTDSNGMCKILTVELGKVKMMQYSSQKKKMKIHAGSAGGRRSRPAAESSKRTSTASSSTAAAARRICRGAAGRSYSMGSYEYVVDPSNLELMIAPTPFPGRPQNWAPSRPTHRSALSDSIPELASAGGTPAAAAKDDLFWASRGLYNTPRTLSRVRELLSPSPGSAISAFSPVAFLDSAGSSSSPSAAAPGHVFRDHHHRQWTNCINNNMESKIEAADLEGDEEEEEVHSDYLEAPSGRSMYFESAPGSGRSTAYFEAAGSGRSIYFETPSGSFYFEADDEARSGYWSESQQNRELEESQSAAVTSDSQPQTPGQSFRARFQAAVRAKLLRTDQSSTNGAAIPREKLLAATADEEAILHTNNDSLARRSSSLSRLPDQAAKTSSTVMSSLFRRSLSETSGLNVSDDQQHLQVWDVPSSTRTTAAAAASTTTASRESWKLNMSSSSSCTDQSIMAAAAGAGGGSKSKRYTLNWLVGRDRRVVYSAATPPLPPPPPPLPLVLQDAASCKETPGALC
jgi:hypothetical protein